MAPRDPIRSEFKRHPHAYTNVRDRKQLAAKAPANKAGPPLPWVSKQQPLDGWDTRRRLLADDLLWAC